MELGNEIDKELKERFIELLSGRFRPADGPGHADNFLSTEQLFAMLTDHEPDLVETRTSIRRVLIAIGFREHLVGDQLMWMVRHSASPA